MPHVYFDGIQLQADCESRDIGPLLKIHFPTIETEKLPEQEENEMPVRCGTETILLVEDNASIMDLCKRFLSHSGYQVINAFNGKQALEIYKKNREAISLVILDLIMPEMGGWRCLTEILRINPKAKVIIETGYSVSDQERAALDGVTGGFLKKPYDMMQLLNKVREVLDEDWEPLLITPAIRDVPKFFVSA